MKVKSIKKNYIYNLIFTTINMIFPLITAPYLSRVLGVENIGRVNYANSIVSWFVLFAAFGIPRYGVREIARNRDKRKELSNSFWNLFLIQFVLSIISILIYLVMIFNVSIFKENIQLYILMVIMIFLNIFSIDWFYQGIEEYGYITARNIMVKLISLALIFLIVRQKENYILYALINIIGVSFNNILNYFNIRKYIDKKIYKIKFFYYIRELRVYFLTTLIISIYTQLDQTFVGSISQKDLAFYIRSKTVQSVGISVVNSLTTVFIPRTAYLIKNNYNEYKNIIKKSINYIYILAFPCVAGIFLLSRETMFLLGGEAFLPATISLKIISIVILLNSIGTWQVNQILLPKNKEKLSLNIQISVAIFSIILNIILIPRYSYIGAAITWVLSETFLVIVEGIFIKYKFKDLYINYISVEAIKYLISTIIMSIIILIIKNLINNNLVIIALSIIIGVLTYLISLILLRDKFITQIIIQTKNKYINNQ
ncbi:flippase [Clostridium perfringens]|nr:flippase [Clostridium perfringens]